MYLPATTVCSRNRWRNSLLALLILSLSPIVTANELPPYSRAYSPARDPFVDGRAAISLARQTQRRVLIELGGDWCRWCIVLDRFLAANAQVRQQLHRHFVVLKVNVSDANDNAAFLAGLPPNQGYPHIFVADRDGSIIHSQDTARFLVNGQYSPQRVLAFIQRWRLPANGATR